jgi:putative FmdB family regulatory protein
MPTYNYECSNCGHSFEHFQSMTSRKKRKCPECKEPKLVRLIGPGAGIIFKGTGFYETDYKQKKKKED